MRGWEEAGKLPLRTVSIVSFGKSGRTWFRVLHLALLCAQAWPCPRGSMMEFDEFHRANPKIPVLFFTHDNYLKDYRRP